MCLSKKKKCKKKNDSNKRGEYRKFDECSYAVRLPLLSLLIVDSSRHLSSTVSTSTLPLSSGPPLKSLSSSASPSTSSTSCQGRDKANNARQSHHKSKAAKPLSHDDLMNQYKDTSYLTARDMFLEMATVTLAQRFAMKLFREIRLGRRRKPQSYQRRKQSCWN